MKTEKKKPRFGGPPESEHTTRTKLIAKIVRECLAAETFTTESDLKEAVKVRCARLKIPYDSDLIAASLSAVNSNTRLVKPPAPRVQPARRFRQPYDDPWPEYAWPPRSASRGMTHIANTRIPIMDTPHETESPDHDVVALVRDLLETQTFATERDLRDAARLRCAQLQIPDESDHIVAALWRIHAKTLPAPNRPPRSNERR